MSYQIVSSPPYNNTSHNLLNPKTYRSGCGPKVEHCRPQWKKKEENRLKNPENRDESETRKSLPHILSPGERAEVFTAILTEVFHQFVLIVEKYIF